MQKIAALMLFLVVLAACQELNDAPATPTVNLVPTAEETLIAEDPTATNTPIATRTSTATITQTASTTPSRTLTRTPSQTPSRTATTTPVPSETATDTPTATNSPSPTETNTPTPTSSPTSTPTRTPVQFNTRAPSATVTPTASNTNEPTPTTTPTETPSPTDTQESGNSSQLGRNTPTPFRLTEEDLGVTLGNDEPTLTPLPFSSPTAIPTLAPLVQDNTPLFNNNAGVEVAQANANNVNIVPNTDAIITADPNRAPTVIRTEAYGGGAAAFVGNDDQLVVNGAVLDFSPASQFGLNTEQMQVVDMQWTGDGRFLTVALDGNLQATDQVGVWVLDMVNRTSQQLFRNSGIHARRVQWSPNGTVVLIMTDGNGITFLPREYNINAGNDPNVRIHPFSDATWASNNLSVIASGGDSITRILLDNDQSYQVYPVVGLGSVRAAMERSGQFYFLGAVTPDSEYALYGMLPNGNPQRISNPVRGQILSWEWNATRSGLLVLMQTDQGNRLFIFRTNGAVQDITPANGAPLAAYWN